METKQLKITPPEGYEIDKENSTFECIKFKKKVTNITYADIVDRLFSNNKIFYTVGNGGISSYYRNDSNTDPNNALSKEQLHRILAINQLFNIAKYYNGDWEPTPEDKGWIIDSTTPDGFNGYSIAFDSRFVKSFPRFRNKDDAWAVIYNPNFRPILDAIFK